MEIMWGPMKQIRCHLCGQEKAEERVGTNEWHSVDCGNCGQYEIGDMAWEYRFNARRPTVLTDKERGTLASWVKKTSTKEERRVQLVDIRRIDQIIGREPPEPGISII